MCLKCPPMPVLEEVRLKLEEAVAERVKLKPRERKKSRKRIKNIDSK